MTAVEVVQGTQSGPMHAHMRAMLLRGAGAVLVIQVAGSGLTYLLHVALARWAGSTEYGVYAYAWGWTQLLALICGLGMTTAVLKLVPEYLQHQDWPRLAGVLRYTRTVTLAAGAACSLLLAVTATWVSRHGMAALLIAAVLVPLLALSNLQAELLRGFQFMAAAYAPGAVLRPLVSGGLAYAALRVTGKLSGQTMLSLVGMAVGVGLVVQHLFLQSQLRREVSAAEPSYEVKQWWELATPMFLIAVFLQLVGQMDMLMIGGLLGAKQAGLYYAASRTAGLLSYFVAATNAISAPLIARLYASREQIALQSLVRSAVHGAFWPSLALAIAMAVFARPLLLAFGNDFLAARAALLVLLAGQLCSVMTGPVAFLLTLTGHHRSSLKLYAVAVVFSLAMNALLVSAYGLLGGAIATALTMAGCNLALVVVVKRQLNITALPFA